MTTSADDLAAPAQWWDPTPAAGQRVDWLAWANALPFCRDIGLECLELDMDSDRCATSQGTMIAGGSAAGPAPD
jgi:hypothetical protein